MRRRWVAAAGVGLVLAATLAMALWEARRPSPLPATLAGTIVYVSDRTGMDALYLRRLPDGQDQRLTQLHEPSREPAVSPDGRMVAFSTGGRIGLVDIANKAVRFLTFGVEWRDGSPAWRSDGKALVVSARRRGEAATADLHQLSLPAPGGETAREALTETAGLDETSPTFGPADATVIFVREDGVFRLDLAGRGTRRLTGGFRKCRSPRLLPSGRLVYLWTEGKLHGVDTVDLDGKNRELLREGGIYYRTLSPSPDGRFLAATFTFDLAFHPLEALRRRREEVHLLDARGELLGALASSWRCANHSASWR
jgi:Tol biopolymer transport system component